MKILMVCKALHFSFPGGIQTHVWNLCKELVRRNHEVTIISANSIFKTRKPSYVDGIRLITVPYIPGKLLFYHLYIIDDVTFNIFAFFKIKKLIKRQKEKFDLVHIQGRSGYLYSLYKKSGLPPAVVTFHGILKAEYEETLKDKSLPFYKRREYWWMKKYATGLEKRLLNTADGVIAVSQYMDRTLREEFEIDSKHIEIIPNGLNPDEFFPCPEKRVPRRILSVARLESRKGMTYLIKVADMLRYMFKDLTVHIVGDGELRQILARQIEELGIQDVVKLRGNKVGDELLQEYHEAEVFVLPSMLESQGIVFMEAMACGLPVVGFDIAGVDEVITHESEGYLVRKGDRFLLAKRIGMLFKDNELAEEFGKQGRHKIDRFYRWSNVAELTEKYYKQVTQPGNGIAEGKN